MPGFSLLHFPTWNCPLVAGPSHGSAQTWRFSHYWGSQNKRLAVLWSLGRWSGEDQVENTGFWVRMEKSVFSFSTPPPSPPPMSLSQQMSPEEGLCPRQQQITGPQNESTRARNANIWREWLARGVWVFACFPFKDCHALAIHQVCCGEDSFPPRPVK